jgi:hypothetical protein
MSKTDAIKRCNMSKTDAIKRCNMNKIDHFEKGVFIGQVTRVATHRIYDAIHYNSIPTLSQQLLFNYYATPL